MSDEAFSLQRVIAPAPPNSRAQHEGELQALHTRAAAHLDAYIHPNPPETYHQPWTQVEHIYARKLRQLILQAEYALRCFLLFLAGELLARSEGRKRAESLLERPARAPRRERSYSIFAEHQEKRPALGRFTAFSLRVEKKAASKKDVRTFEPYDWEIVDCSRLIRRLKRLPAAIAKADAHALRFAAHILSGEIALSEDDLSGPRVGMAISERAGAGLRTEGENWGRAQTRSPSYPGFFRRLLHWYPPPDMMDRADDEARGTLISLHAHASEMLITLNTRLA
ncbi:hypothetical protein [Ponticaulis sp.]|uniref:hypothetical protein n=1 Tax=Ponticaulis sp. TaxID=2020902 RepID=UPI000B75DD2E|nr:hypothetical protein [Ponticaulis sp.]MAI90951.1 hypothetical protein [Ponticaulis sp.]OUX98292.1 MAG: hypothetical protein CBB65_10940 [Hyphomonadaceae bacterium TMED5]|tara:strand:+ start:13044 stop:13889 length:846 start_codon:yes stop_codon:yes gene_type:complete